jgi:hypothetical protein
MGKMKELALIEQEKFARNNPLRPDETYDMKECPECKGEKHFDESSCCGTSISNGICMECGEHTDPTKCTYCLGFGMIPKDELDKAIEREDAMISNDELKRDIFNE